MTNKDFIYYLCGRLAEINNLKKIESQNINKIISLINTQINLNNIDSNNINDNDFYEDSSDDYINQVGNDFRNRVIKDLDLDQQDDIW